MYIRKFYLIVQATEEMHFFGAELATINTNSIRPWNHSSCQEQQSANDFNRVEIE